jgi:POT family proton-dependent oligopeptide transporter
MKASTYRTAPADTTGMPKGIPYIIANEAAERFSYYGMRGILVVFLTQYLLGSNGELSVMTKPEAMVVFHFFVASAYFVSVLGALLADAFIGKYRTIMILSVVYVMGHVALAADETRLGLYTGLTLIALGSGGIKPCVSAHVGDQFGKANEHLLSRAFHWFYFSINFGALLSAILIPVVLEEYGPGLAFGIPGVLMALATVFFWMGRNTFAHIPAGGMAFLREVSGPIGRGVLFKMIPFFGFIAVFWSLFDQTGSTWVLQAESMNTTVFGKILLPAQIQFVNPLLVLILTPVFCLVIYPFAERYVRVTPLRKIGVGLSLAGTTFLVSAWVQSRIDAGFEPTVWWQIGGYVLLTAAEVMVSITALEFAYTQAPKTMKSLVVSLYLLSVSAGNLFTALVNVFIQKEDGSIILSGPAYHLFFAGLMFVSAALYIVYACFFKERRYIQGEIDEADAEATTGA